MRTAALVLISSAAALLLAGCVNGPLYPWTTCPPNGPYYIGCAVPAPGPGPCPVPGPGGCPGFCNQQCTAYHPNYYYRCHNNKCVTYSPYAPNRCDPVPYYTGCKYASCCQGNYTPYL